MMAEGMTAAASAGPVLVVGDANVDLILRGDVAPRFGQEEQLLDGAELVLGSSASIVACGLATLGVPTSLVAVIGDDDFGRFVNDALTRAGVDTASVRVDDSRPTGISVILSASDDRAILTLPGTIPLLTPADVLAAVDRSDARWVHIASPFLMPHFLSELPQLLSELRERGLGISLDTNWDPSGTWAGIGELLPFVDVLLPNAAELEALADALVPGIDRAAAAVEISGRGPRVVIKDGADGGWSFDRHGVHHSAPGLSVAVIDTTGAGDSFDAGYLAAIASGVESEQLRLRWATVAGSLSTRAVGGTAAQVDRNTLTAMLVGDAQA